MLPKIKVPTFETHVPTTKKVIKFRPMEVKEEKILLMARQSGQPADFFAAIIQVTNNCMIDDKVDVSKMPLCDVEFIFTKIRSASISNIAKVSYIDPDDKESYPFEIDLDKVDVKFPDDVSNEFSVLKDLSFTMKYPPISLYAKSEFFDLSDDGIFDMLVQTCLDKVFDGDDVADAADVKPEEILEFVNSLPAKVYHDLRKFFTNLPTLYNEVKYTNKLGKEVVIRQRSIEDFFTFG